MIGPTARLIQVIQTTLEVRGSGATDNGLRRVTQYWTLDGELLAENDPLVTGQGEVLRLPETREEPLVQPVPSKERLAQTTQEETARQEKEN